MTEPAALKAEVLFSVVPEWVTFHPALTGNDVRLYNVLARFADTATGRCFPGQTLLAQRAHISERALRDCVDRLEAVGAVTVRKRWVDAKGTIHYHYGPGKQATSSEYILRVTQTQGVPAKSAGRYRQDLPDNENQEGSTSPAESAGTPDLRLSARGRARRASDEQDRLALRGRWKPWAPPAGAVWSDEHDAWQTPDGTLHHPPAAPARRPR